MPTMHGYRAAIVVGRFAIQQPLRKTRPILQPHNLQPRDRQRVHARHFNSWGTFGAQKDESREKEPGQDHGQFPEQGIEQPENQHANPAHKHGIAETQQTADGWESIPDEDLPSADLRRMLEDHDASNLYRSESTQRSPRGIRLNEHWKADMEDFWPFSTPPQPSNSNGSSLDIERMIESQADPAEPSDSEEPQSQEIQDESPQFEHPDRPILDDDISKLTLAQFNPSQQRHELTQEEDVSRRRPSSAQHRSDGTSWLYIDGNPVDVRWIRNSCVCPQCRDKHSGQRLFATAHIFKDLRPLLVQSPGGTRSVRWKYEFDENHQPHKTTLEGRYHLRKQGIAYRQETSASRTPWDHQIFATSHEWIDFHSFLDGKTNGLPLALDQLVRLGIVLMKNIPRSERAVENIAERLGGLRDTFYGSTWDVRSVPAATNIAYTHGYLGPHTDLMYMMDPPKLQILHSLQADAPGGDSILSDGLYAAATMLREYPQYFDILTRWPVTYEYRNKARGLYRNSHPTIKLQPDNENFAYQDELSSIEGIYYSPPFQSHRQPSFHPGVDGHPTLTFNDYLKAIRIFAGLSEDSKSTYQRRLNPGEAIIFDNRRILHSRTAFDASQGTRWLKGAYVDTDGYLALLRQFKLLAKTDRKGFPFTTEEEKGAGAD